MRTDRTPSHQSCFLFEYYQPCFSHLSSLQYLIFRCLHRWERWDHLSSGWWEAEVWSWISCVSNEELMFPLPGVHCDWQWKDTGKHSGRPQICISTCQYNSALPACCSTCQAEIIKQSCRKCRLSAVSEGISGTNCLAYGTAPFWDPREFTELLKQVKSEQKSELLLKLGSETFLMDHCFPFHWIVGFFS